MRSIRAALSVLAIGAAACGGKLAAPIPSAHGDDDATPRRGGTLHLANIADVRNLDPAGPQDGLSQQAVHLVFAGLVDYDEHADVVADLAERWDVSGDGLTYRFTLRRGVTMHDGEELTADDVKRSVDRALHPSTPNPDASYFDNLAAVAVEGRYAVTFRLKERDAAFLPLLATTMLRPTCKSAGDRYLDTWLPCGAGPFKLEPGGWQRGVSLRIVRHDRYFRANLPYLDAIEWTYNMQAISQRFRFEQGSLDLIRDLPQSDLLRFTADARWKRYGVEEADNSIYGESMNTRMAPFDNVEVRRAVAAALDREHYRLLKPTNVRAATQLLPPTLPAYDASFQGQRYDYRAALDHMRAAGYPFDPATGAGGWPHPIEYVIYDQGLPVFAAQVTQQQLAKIGLRIRLKIVSWPAFLALITRPPGVAMTSGNWLMDYPDPSAFFDALFTTSAIGPDASYNYAFYSNARFDDLVVRARRELDAGKRAALYREANEILRDDAPWAFTFGYHFYSIRQPYVRGYAPHPVWSMDASRVWLDRGAP